MTPLERRILDISFKFQLSHIGSCLTCVSIIDDIYKRKKPEDKCIISCGHAHIAHAVVMEKYGIINDAEANILEHGIHCERAGGCDVSTGSLGQGICIALGMALADRSRDVYCLLSDGECTEGSVYEAAHVRRENKLDNLKVSINLNGYAAYRKTGVGRLYHLNFMEIFGRGIIDTSQHWFMQKYGQEAHYKILTPGIYEEIIRS